MGPIRDEIAALELSGIGKVASGALGDPEVIPLWFGESDLVTAPFIRDAAKQALDEGRTFYNFSRGVLPLREALQRYHERIYGIDLHPDRITVPGSTMLSVLAAVQCLAARGDEVILIGPYWPNIRTVCLMMGAKPVDVRLEETQGRVSSGLRVGEAADNAAYWSFATTMRSDNMAISAVQDALGLGSEARMNRPASTGGNWDWRLPPRAVTAKLARHLAEMAEIYGRANLFGARA